MKLWLDDTRDPALYGFHGTDWVWAKTAAEAIMLLKTGEIDEATLDHDLAAEHYPYDVNYNQNATGTGYDVVCWMERNNVWPVNGTRVHSMNPVGRARMEQVIERAYDNISRR